MRHRKPLQGLASVADDDRVEEVRLRNMPPRSGLIHRRDADHVRAQCIHHRLQVREPVTDIGADRKHGTHHYCAPDRDRRERRATTATSPNVNGIGAFGLCTTASTA